MVSIIPSIVARKLVGWFIEGRHQQAAVSIAGKDDLPSREVLADRSRAFEDFRISYSGNPVIDANKAQLKTKYGEAKACGQQVQQPRSTQLCQASVVAQGHKGSVPTV